MMDETKIATPTIYSYYSPEVRNVVRLALNRQNEYDGIHATLRKNYSPGLDELHLPLMDRYERFARSEGVIGLDTFDAKYFTNGSSEGIFHLITGLPPAETLYQFDGEYQGYEAFANSVGRQIITVKNMDDLMHSSPGILILSNPASRDGNVIDSRYIRQIGEKHRIILDLAYMGMTQIPLNLDLTDDAILAVLGSLSKPFGLYYYRIGFCYSRHPVSSLCGNKWFKNALSIKIGEAVLDHFASKNLQRFKDHYFELQAKGVKAINDEFGLSVGSDGAKAAVGSDVWLLAKAPYRDMHPSDLNPFKRGEFDPCYRFCLMPYYMENDK
jgi:hypothetical protein